MRTEPSLSVVVVAPGDVAQIRRAVSHLAAQDIAGEVELVIVASTDAAVSDHAEAEPFAAVRVVAAGPVTNVDRAAARGILAATGEIVAVVEDHAFVQPNWARAIIGAYRGGPWVSVGSVMENANPRRGLSWANLLLGYGWWISAEQAGEMPDVPSHNGSYRRSAVVAFREKLADRMGWGEISTTGCAPTGEGCIWPPTPAWRTSTRRSCPPPPTCASTRDACTAPNAPYRPAGRPPSDCSMPPRRRSSHWSACGGSMPSTWPPGGLMPIWFPASCPGWRSPCCSTPAARRPDTCAGRDAPPRCWRSSRWTADGTSPGRTAVCCSEAARRRPARKRRRRRQLVSEPLTTAGELPRVSVVIPAFRRGERLRTCLEALAAQDYPPARLEVVVVDDGSPEPLSPVAAAFEPGLRVRVHRQPNAGPAVARNAGARLASGDVLLFTDDDCTPSPDWVRRLAAAARPEPDTLAGGHVVNTLTGDRLAAASQELSDFLYDWYGEHRRGRSSPATTWRCPGRGSSPSAASTRPSRSREARTATSASGGRARAGGSPSFRVP